MKSNICINVEFLAGTSIEQAVIEAKDKAILWQVAYVKFDFNGVKMSIRSSSSVIEAVDRFHQEIKKSSKEHKFVIC